MNLVVALPFFFDCGTGNLFNEPQEPLPNNGEWRTDTYLFVADAMHCGSLAGAGRAHDLAGDVDALREARATARLLRQRAAGWQNAALVWRAAAAAAALGALVALKMAQRPRGSGSVRRPGQ